MRSRKFKKRPVQDSERGATILEFSITAVFMLFILGGIFDVGLGLYNWTLLRQATEEASRQIAVDFTTNPDCTNISTYLSEVSEKRLGSELGADVNPDEMLWCLSWWNPEHQTVALDTFPVLRLTGRFTAPCYFLCPLFPKGIPLGATSESVIQIAKSCVDQAIPQERVGECPKF